MIEEEVEAEAKAETGEGKREKREAKEPFFDIRVVLPSVLCLIIHFLCILSWGFGSFGSNLKFGYVEAMKEPEIEIGLPTDVKHVAHIGWDGSTNSAPSWVRVIEPPHLEE
ncbi:unnamed protein product [Fraxinus pennsylvanica]|uniref:CRIB domain-containing protein n=1 Tax=Fraxinus pennsylvanica TaxID=56036 RepID=A0AAD1ZP36_9LAMI|nr:unnamed protein product [Fraxinus pennsylvanica]